MGQRLESLLSHPPALRYACAVLGLVVLAVLLDAVVSGLVETRTADDVARESRPHSASRTEPRSAEASAAIPSTGRASIQSASRVARVHGRVVDEQRQPVADAEVVAEALHSDAVWRGTSASDGTLDLPAFPGGGFSVRASARGFATAQVELIDVDRFEIVLAHARETSLSGTVLCEMGPPIPRARVRLLASSGSVVAETTSDAHGAYELPWQSRRPGQVLVASAEGYTTELTHPAPAPGDGPVLVDFRLCIARRLLVTCIDKATRRPLADARLSVAMEGAALSLHDEVQPIGTGQLLWTRAPRVTFELDAEAEGYASARAWIGDPIAMAPEEVTIHLSERGSVSVAVVGPEGLPVTAFVRAVPVARVRDFETGTIESRPRSAGAWSDGNGRVKAELDSSVDYEVAITARGCAPRSLPAPVRVPPGETLDLGTIELTSGDRLAGVVLSSSGAPAAQARVTASFRLGHRLLNHTIATRTDGQGKFVVDGIPDGAFPRLWIRNDHEAAEVSRAVPGEYVTINLAPLGDGTFVRGACVNLSGIPLESVPLRFTSSSGAGEVTSTDACGRFAARVSEGETVEIHYAGLENLTFLEGHPLVVDNSSSRYVELTLAQVREVSGRLLLPGEVRAESIRVSWHERPLHDARGETFANADGTFLLPVPCDTPVVLKVSGEGIQGDQRTLTVEPSRAPFELEDWPVTATVDVAIRVSTASGRRLANSRVYVHRDGFVRPIATVVTDARGVALFGSEARQRVIVRVPHQSLDESPSFLIHEVPGQVIDVVVPDPVALELRFRRPDGRSLSEETAFVAIGEYSVRSTLGTDGAVRLYGPFRGEGTARIAVRADRDIRWLEGRFSVVSDASPQVVEVFLEEGDGR